MTATNDLPKAGEAIMKAGTKNGSYVMLISVPQRKKRVAAERYATAEECREAGKEPGPMNHPRGY